MKRLTPAALVQAYRDPVSWLILAVDLFPVIAIFQLGWGAAALVFLYWLENLVIGFITLLRMFAAAAATGASAIVGAFAFGAFFLFHYGMFCFVHGVFLMVFAEISAGTGENISISPLGLVRYALSTGGGMFWFLGTILALQLFLFLRDFIFRGAYRETNPMLEMAKPYGRIVVLHIALFAGFGLLICLGEPFVGVLALILLRAVWGAVQSVRRQQEIAAPASPKVDEASPI
ncbi:hypothetical protein D1224_09115 [Henriciella barbarensis]|uniref:Uncharacterized protein n=1 Tax=Henriciella barbarensis TaxID=86342 RepID=A0A399QZQ8_9PROT|nr:DUF6498-containing protein [Henriciella barbarensis]RIJ24378.1 hypothetical protein D1224_09115 [Henriciella barbarensis]